MKTNSVQKKEIFYAKIECVHDSWSRTSSTDGRLLGSTLQHFFISSFTFSGHREDPSSGIVAICPVVYAIINAGTISRKGSKTNKENIFQILTIVVLERMVTEEELK